jgi:hypothetical protein
VIEGARLWRPCSRTTTPRARRFVDALVATGVEPADAERRATFVLGPKARRRGKA